MESQYDSTTWARETTFGRRVFNHNFRMLGRELAGWELVKSVPMHRDDVLSETTYIWRNRAAPVQQVVRINVGELPDWRAAQKHLLVVLEHSMRPDLPRGTDKHAHLGDVRFVAKASPSDVTAAVRFTRGNIAVDVNSAGSVTVDVSSLAAVVDRLLSEPPTKLPFLRRLSKLNAPRTVAVKGKDAVSVVKDVTKAGDSWLKVLVPDGELRRKGGAIVYTSGEPAKKAVQVFSIRAPGTGKRKP